VISKCKSFGKSGYNKRLTKKLLVILSMIWNTFIPSVKCLFKFSNHLRSIFFQFILILMVPEWLLHKMRSGQFSNFWITVYSILYTSKVMHSYVKSENLKQKSEENNQNKCTVCIKKVWIHFQKITGSSKQILFN
jgi:hypothetical protein